MSALIFVISAPSGAGKSSTIAGLRDNIGDLAYSVSHTTRKPRHDEKDGVHYHFVDEEVFRAMIDQKAFVEWAPVYEALYGTSYAGLKEQQDRGMDVLLDVDSQGARNIRRHFKDSVLIYILPPSLGSLAKRLKDRRTDKQEVIDQRMEKAAREIKNCVWYDYIVVNEDLAQAVSEVQCIVISERCRAAQRLPVIEELFDLSS
jgi:guanylate kinase